MKVRVTLITENNVPVEKLGPNPEAKIKAGWGLLCTIVVAESENEDCAYVESVEIMEE